MGKGVGYAKERSLRGQIIHEKQNDAVRRKTIRHACVMGQTPGKETQNKGGWTGVTRGDAQAEKGNRIGKKETNIIGSPGIQTASKGKKKKHKVQRETGRGWAVGSRKGIYRKSV